MFMFSLLEKKMYNYFSFICTMIHRSLKNFIYFFWGTPIQGHYPGSLQKKLFWPNAGSSLLFVKIIKCQTKG